MSPPPTPDVILPPSLKYAAQFIDTCADGIIIFDQKFLILCWNSAMEGISLIKRVQAIGKTIFDLYPFLEKTKELINFSEALQGKSLTSSGEYFFHKDGIRDFFSLRYTPLQENAGQIFAAMMTLSKASKADYYLTQQQETESRFRIMADCAPVMLWMAGKDAECYFFNQVWLTFTGKSIEEEKGVGWASGVHPEDLQQMMNTYLHAFNRQENFSMIYRLRRHDGEYRWILDQGTPLYNATQEFEGFIGSCVDITEQKLSKEKLEEVTVSLMRTNQELEQMARVASHDLQEPLRTIVSYSQLLVADYKGKLNPDADDILQKIVTASSRMQQLICSMLDYSSVTQDTTQHEKISMDELVGEVLADLAQIINNSNAEITFSQLPQVMGYRLQIKQVLQNIICNAIKFRGPEPIVIKIECQEKLDNYLFIIRDNGIGFDMKYAVKIFEVFKRLWTKDQYSGDGLGLAICKKIIENHEGEIWAQAEVNKGACIYFTLPKTHCVIPRIS